MQAMVATVFGPLGIVSATLARDFFFEAQVEHETTFLNPISVDDLPHQFVFWERYVLLYGYMNQYSFESKIQIAFSALMSRWDYMPKIQEFMPYLKKMIIDEKIQIIGIMSAYEECEGLNIPYVYQILGESICRINTDSDGKVIFNCAYLETEPCVGKLFQPTRIQNGNIWENTRGVRPRCDLYSIKKSLDLCRFMLRTGYYAENVNMASCDTPLSADVAIVTPESIEMKVLNI